MPLPANDLLRLRDDIVAAMQAASTFAGVTVVGITSGDIASRVAKLRAVPLVVSVAEPVLAPGSSAIELLAEFDIHIDECVEINRRGSSYRRGEDLLIATFILLFNPASPFQPLATASEAILDGHVNEDLNVNLGGQFTPVVHRALGGHFIFTLQRH